MGPTRTAKSAGRGSKAGSSKTGTYQKKPHGKNKSAFASSSTAATPLPGVQKVKAALRQTRRLLAKDTLAADVRVATERKLKALEAELADAERARKERALAQRYHKVKFFERQKVTRKLKQVQRHLESCTDKQEKKRLGEALFELRVDLNYILHYPKLKKYISLFPPEVRHQASEVEKSPKGKEKESAVDSAVTNVQREEIRAEIRERMEKGELSDAPERDHRDSKTQADKASAAMSTKRTGHAHQIDAKLGPDIREDAFFGEDSAKEDDDGEAEASEDSDSD